ncbi:hypothetical protein Angca_000458, partial [Angiostrongylus cantonensis]
FLQHLRNYEYTWDSVLSNEHQQQWSKIVEDTNRFQANIPREIIQIGVTTKLVLFAEASKECMTTCAYIVSNNESQLLTGKSRLLSRKDNPTIPKFELNALTMATRLAQSIHGALKSHTIITDIIIFSDSEIALNWIRSQKATNSYGTLIKNRIKEIRQIVEKLPTPIQFGYIDTNHNPADCATRGLSKYELENHMW